MKKILSMIIAVVVSLIAVNFVSCKKSDKITTYDIDIMYEDGVITGTEAVNFYNDTENAFNELKFNLYGNAFRKGAKYSPISKQYSRAYYDGESYGDIEIASVKSGEKDLTFTVCGEDDNILSVKLESEVYPNESVAVEISYTLTLAKVIARTGINGKAVNLANFYPILCGIQDGSFYECVYYSNGDPYYSDVANYEITFICPKEYVVAHSGNLISQQTENNKTIYNYKMENSRSFAIVLSKDYKVITDNSLGVEINYYFYNDEDYKKSLEVAVESLKYFSEKFGEYPYTAYSVCQTEFMQGGMEFPSLVYISDELERKAYNEVIVHETAHQWWQTAVGNNEIESGYLDEGLAEYSVVMFYEDHEEYGYTRENLVKSAEQTYKVYCSVYDKVFGKVDTTMDRSLGEFNSEYEYVNIAYVKPTIMYDTLRSSIGDEKFISGLQKYYKANKLRNATVEELIQAFNDAGGDCRGYFESFIKGKAII